MKKTIKLDDRELTIEKLPIGRYAELLKSLQELPRKFANFEQTPQTQLIEIIPKLVGEALPDVLRIIEIATPLESEEVEKLGLAEVVDILVAIFEVNNYAKVFETIKKVQARPVAKSKEISTP